MRCLGFSIILSFLALFSITGIFAETLPDGIERRENWWLAEDYNQYAIGRVAVLPMENLSLEPGVEKALYDTVYERLTAKGYIKIDADEIASAMERLGIQTAGQLAGISPARIGKILHCDAIIKGRVDQSGAIHMGVYDALVVSISLQLVDCRTGKTVWTTEQWRAAHRQWHADPFNLLLSFTAHELASRELRVAWLVQEMLKTLPDGPVQVVEDNFLNEALTIPADKE